MTSDDLRTWRDLRDISAAEAARQLGTARNTYIAMEAGRSRVPLYIALACSALAMNVPPWPVGR